MTRYLIRRFLWAIVLFIAVTMVTYMIFFIIPAAPARLAVGQRATPETVARARHYLGLDKPVPVQYALFLKRLTWDHSLGRSFTNRQDVTHTILDAAPVTASIVAGGAVFWMLLALPIGIMSALRPRSLLDRGGMVFVLIGVSTPAFWIALILQYSIGFKWKLLPNAGYCDLIHPNAGTCGGPWPWFQHLVLPWMTFAFIFAAIYVRMIRANVMETLNEDYVRTARAKGAPERIVLFKHVLRNALLPIVTMLGMDIGLALGGAIFTESVFGLHGLGKLVVQSYDTFDLPTIQGVVVFSTVCIIVFNLVVDLLYAWIDPRIRLA